MTLDKDLKKAMIQAAAVTTVSYTVRLILKESEKAIRKKCNKNNKK